ncbi:hypothetical protein H1R20_g7605, partial [Candolleomyces eurysporus]
MNSTTERAATGSGEEGKQLRILQVNLNRSPTAHWELLNSGLANLWDIILIQEPSQNYYNHSATAPGFRQIYPSDKARSKNGGRFHSGIWVNQQIGTNSWREYKIHDDPDFTAIQILSESGPLTIINIYFGVKGTEEHNEDAIGYVDDAIFVATDETFNENIETV